MPRSNQGQDRDWHAPRGTQQDWHEVASISCGPAGIACRCRSQRQSLAAQGHRTLVSVGGSEGRAFTASLGHAARRMPQVKDFAHRLARAVAQSDPDYFTAALAKAPR